MLNKVFIFLLKLFFLENLLSKKSAKSKESSIVTLPRMDVVSVAENKNKCILLKRDGTSDTLLLTDEYCVRPTGIYKKIKGKWIQLPDVIGITVFVEL